MKKSTKIFKMLDGIIILIVIIFFVAITIYSLWIYQCTSVCESKFETCIEITNDLDNPSNYQHICLERYESCSDSCNILCIFH